MLFLYLIFLFIYIVCSFNIRKWNNLCRLHYDMGAPIGFLKYPKRYWLVDFCLFLIILIIPLSINNWWLLGLSIIVINIIPHLAIKSAIKHYKQFILRAAQEQESEINEESTEEDRKAFAETIKFTIEELNKSDQELLKINRV
jgi:hypothetical protein